MTKATIVVHWPRFGPYHLARLKAAQRYVEKQKHGVAVIGLETARIDETYAWRVEEKPDELYVHTLFPNQVYDKISRVEMWQRLSHFLSQQKPMAVAITGYTSKDAQAILIWCKLNGCPAILMNASKEDDAPRVWIKEFIKKKIVRRYSSALCGGALQKAYLEKLGIPRGKIFLGYNAVDNLYFSEAAKQVRNQYGSHAVESLKSTFSSPYFLASNRFVPRKNLSFLLEVYAVYKAKMIEAKYIPWRLVLLGDGPEMTKLKQLTVHYGLTNHVDLPGFCQIDQLPSYYGLANAFVHPALQEQWGLVVNEAMASGLPVLVSERCGCAPELVRNGKNGFVFDPENVEQSARLMLDFSTGKYDLSAMGQASQEIVANWGPDQFANGLYQAVQVTLT
jgi:1,2-diacylglycerol 3-alpha-glucosyltransferase